MNKAVRLDNSRLALQVTGAPDSLWRYTVKSTGESYDFRAPTVELNGEEQALQPHSLQLMETEAYLHGVTEYRISGECGGGLILLLVFQLSEANPVVRFRYEISGGSKTALTKRKGRDNLVYLSLPDFQRRFARIKEVRFSEFNELIHSFNLVEHELSHSWFDNDRSVMGPMLTGIDPHHSALLAYEHGSQSPDAFLEFGLQSDLSVSLRAVKGNYYDGLRLDGRNAYETCWFHFAAVPGGENPLAGAYREFTLRFMSASLESRKPYIFYNTWANQERSRYWSKGNYLDPLHLERVLAEIDAAHSMGIEVYVIDAGWFDKTGDWNVNPERFPDGLKQVKRKLDDYGMKLGLWFEPASAAVSSGMLARNRANIITWNGQRGEPRPVWETEASHRMCLVSAYGDDFARTLIRLVREVGVTYFKWDAVGQYGCNDPGHWHGTEANPPEERADSYAFQVGQQLTRIARIVCEACPEAIFDFDITEGFRSVGLGFLSAGKYFLINNGPYFVNYDLPHWLEENNYNLFFYPGPARTWICRMPLTFDKWLPTSLFLTHYLPDDPEDSQLVNVASLMLGQNGIWGDLLKVSEEGAKRINGLLSLYKQVREDMTKAAMLRSGQVGGNPEIYEKVNPENGRGAVVMFASSFGKPFSPSVPGTYTYITENRVSSSLWHSDEVDVTMDAQGRAIIQARFDRATAKMIFFGINEN